MKKAISIAGAVALGPTLLIAPVAVALAGSSSAQAACSAGGAQAVDSAAVAKLVKSILKDGSKGSVSVSGLDDPEEQIPNAETIQATGIAMKVPARGQIVALATALQESGLRNLDYGDRDSLGLFQQRPSQGWGTAAEVRDPVHASTKFYEGLLKVSGWQSMTIAQAAQAVQKSGYPDAYAKWEPLATALQKAIAKSLGQNGSSSKDSDTGSEAEQTANSTTAGCSTGEDGSSFDGFHPADEALQPDHRRPVRGGAQHPATDRASVAGSRGARSRASARG